MTSGSNNFNDFPDNQSTKFRVFYWLLPDFLSPPLNFYEALRFVPPAPHRMNDPDRHNGQTNAYTRMSLRWSLTPTAVSHPHRISLPHRCPSARDSVRNRDIVLPNTFELLQWCM